MQYLTGKFHFTIYVIIILTGLYILLLYSGAAQLFSTKLNHYYQTDLKNITTKCSKLNNLQNVVLAINFNYPFYSNIPVLKEFYSGIFAKVVFCGSNATLDVVKVEVRWGYQGYLCIARAIELFPGFSGYFYINDDVVLNWWNVIDLDTSKIWTGDKIDYSQGHLHGDKNLPPWIHWRTDDTAHGCEVAFNQTVALCKSPEGKRLNLSNCLKTYFNNTNGQKICPSSWADVFYIPGQYANAYAKISNIYSSNKVFLEAAVPGILAFFLTPLNSIDLKGMYFHSTYYYNKYQKYASGEAFYETYTFDLTFSHPFKFGGNMKDANMNFFKSIVMKYGKDFKQWCYIVNHMTGGVARKKG